MYGASDNTAAYVKDDPVPLEDFTATLYHTLGIDPTTELRDPQDKPYTLNPVTPIRGLIG